LAASKPKIEDIEKWVHYCISCSNCKSIYKNYEPSCPSGEKFLFETYFASGRMKLARALLFNKIKVSEDLVRGVFACTTCGSCEIQCQAPHQEHIIDVIEATREFIVEKLGHPASNQERLVSTIADETKLNPYNESHDDNSAIKEKYQLKDKAEFCYFIGCTATYREKEIRDATLDLFKKIGLDFTVINEQCCGSPLIRTGQTKQIKALSIYNVKVHIL